MLLYEFIRIWGLSVLDFEVFKLYYAREVDEDECYLDWSLYKFPIFILGSFIMDPKILAAWFEDVFIFFYFYIASN